MGLLVDTSVWSLAFRRDTPADLPEVVTLRHSLIHRGDVVTTGMIVLELLRGFVPKSAQPTIREAMTAVEFAEPAREDYIAAAAIGNSCRAVGVQVGSVDALIMQLAISGQHTILTTDRDFHLAVDHVGFRLWRP